MPRQAPTRYAGMIVHENIAKGASSSRDARVGGNLKTTTTRTAVTNTTDEAVLASHVLPANSLVTNTRLDIRFIVQATNTADPTTAIWKIRVGPTTLTGTVVATGAATDVANNNKAHGMFSLYGVAAQGADVGYRIHGWYTEFAGTEAVPVCNIAETGLATNGELRIELCVDLSVADATSVRCEAFSVDIVDPPSSTS